MKRILTLALALMLLLAAPALAATLKPTDDFYVNDSAGVLSHETIGHIVLNNDALYKACGAQIVFVTVDTTGSTKLESYAYKLFNEWKIGGSKNYGFLVVMAIKDDDYWYEIGSGLDQYFTAGDAGELMDTYLEPYFADQDYDGGARALFDALFASISRALKANVSIDNNAYSRYESQLAANNTANKPRTTGGTVQPGNPQPESEGGGYMGLLVLVVVIVVIVLIVRSRKRRRVTTYNNPNPTVIVNNPAPTGSAQSYNRGFLAGMLTGSARRRQTPPPAQSYPYNQVPPQAGRSNTATRPTTAGRPNTATRPTQTPPTGSYGGFTQPPGRASSAGRPRETSRPSSSSSSSIGSTLNSLFGSGSGRSSGGFGRSSSSGRSSGGFGGGRSGGGGSTRGSGGGRHR